MTKATFAAHPYLLGFEQLERLMERTAKSGNEGYPPYNIESCGEGRYRITLDATRAGSIEMVQAMRADAPDWYEARKVEFRGEGYPDLNSIP